MPLPQPSTALGRAGLAAVLAEPARALVAVDFDGTLAPIVTHPQDARPAAGATAALRALSDRLGACAVVSGRPARDVVELAALADVAKVTVLGHYGMQRWHDGHLESPPPAPAIETARPRLVELAATAPAGVHVEDKHHSLVVHTRPAEDPVAALEALLPEVHAIAADLGLEVVPGRFVLELRPPGVNKGAALRALAEEREAAAVIYVGDDLGDLPAFAAVEAMRDHGIAGLTVASVDPELDDAPHEPAERADLVLAGPADVVTFLAALAAAVGEP